MAKEKETTMTLGEQVKEFFSPLCPLGDAIVTFFRTTLGIVVGIILAVWIIACLAGGYYHHRYERGWDDDMVRGGYQGYYDGRDQMRAMQEQMYQAQRAMDQRAHQMQQQAQQTPPSSGQKHVSSIQISDGVEAGYTLSVSDDTIQGSLIGQEVSDATLQALTDAGVTVADDGTFSAPYSPELWQTVMTIVSQRE